MFNRWDTTLICLTKYHFRHFKHKLQKEYSVPLTAGHCHHSHAPDLSEETITYPNDHLHFFGFKYIKMVSALPIHIWVASSNNSHNIVDSYLHRPLDTHESKSKHSWFSSTFSSDTWSICVQQWKSEQWHTNALNFVVRGQSGVQLCLLKKNRHALVRSKDVWTSLQYIQWHTLDVKVMSTFHFPAFLSNRGMWSLLEIGIPLVRKHATHTYNSHKKLKGVDASVSLWRNDSFLLFSSPCVAYVKPCFSEAGFIGCARARCWF